MDKTITQSFERLYHWLHSKPLGQRYLGYDPFDGLNSWWMQHTPLGRSRLMRLLWTQFFKRSPINLRKVLAIKPGYNPQALGLFLHAYATLYRQFGRPADREAMLYLVQQIKTSRIDGYAGACWGYNFPWQARAFYQPAGTPMIVPTMAVFNGLLNAGEVLQDKTLTDLALSAAAFVQQDLNRTYEGDLFAFSYSPLDTSVVYNASLMATRILASTYRHTGDPNLLPDIRQSVRYCVKHQQQDGSWTYGTKSYHQWIDNFHTGYNLECLHSIMHDADISELANPIKKGMQYYLDTFFDNQGRSLYYHDRLWPVDINNPAQLLVTLSKLGVVADHAGLAQRVLHWTIRYMQSKKGYFYYRRYRYFTNKINYLRWSQAWMFYALTEFLYGEAGK